MVTADTEAGLDDLLAAFENGRLPKSDWTHAAHLTVAACLAFAVDATEAHARLRRGIRSLNACHGVANTECSGYHETLTQFWLAIVREFLYRRRAATPDMGRVSAVEALVIHFGGRRDLFRDYYSFDVVGSREARQAWVVPDLQVLPYTPTARLADI